MIQNDLLLRTLAGQTVERPPVWIMRQAGRILPQYRQLRSRFSGFKEFIKTPDAVAEATLQPIDELKVDAAILFSDILVIPEAMGLHYDMIEKRGPLFRQTVQSEADLNSLDSGKGAAEKLEYVYEGLRQTKAALADRVPLIGFAGAPWTIFAYMTEGSGSKTFSKAKRLLYQSPELSHRLLDMITDTTIYYLKQKAAHGVDVLQVFDSWAGILSPEQYREFALPCLQRICDAIDEVPLTIFAKGADFVRSDLQALPCTTLGLDWTMDPSNWKGSGHILQGNLDPCALYGPADDIQQRTKAMIRRFDGDHIVNLGHGVYPDTPLENVRAFVDSVLAYRY